MIYIISEEEDRSTDDVCEFLHNSSSDFVRINSGDSISDIGINLQKSETTFVHKGKKLLVKLSDLIWYRRGRFPYVLPFSKSEVENDKLKSYLEQEISHLSYFFLATIIVLEAMRERFTTINCLI